VPPGAGTALEGPSARPGRRGSPLWTPAAIRPRRPGWDATRTPSGPVASCGTESAVCEGPTGHRRPPLSVEIVPLKAANLARVASLNPDLKKVPRDTRLTPGMTLTAEIKVSERSVISYFMYPLIKAFDESIREP
jgi:hypothetical protein